MRKSEAKLQESEGRDGIGMDDYKAAAFPTLPRKNLISKKTNLHKNSLLVFKVEHQKIVTMAWIHIAAQIYRLVGITGYKSAIILHEKWNCSYSTCRKLKFCFVKNSPLTANLNPVEEFYLVEYNAMYFAGS
ncbi:hypothetical protein B7P43_G01520 [Cryptotermes secundus]|uniref:Uncharacterized protein n=1 Tax=Cryptotermes secundus TaxID=105785 RepID=A0A2J7REU1_9NEOP|nr:hypothetical protein B7P43_G01520 [Cryptotermes secundus]